jgi:hypothetical protein
LSEEQIGVRTELNGDKGNGTLAAGDRAVKVGIDFPLSPFPIFRNPSYIEGMD